jgi:hypothetical protein
MAFMLEPPLSAEHSKAAALLSSLVWLFEFERLRRDAMRFFAGPIAMATAIGTVQHEPDFAGAPSRQNFVFAHTVVLYLAQRAAPQRHEDQKIATAGPAEE